MTLKTFLESVAPGSVMTSTSEHVPLLRPRSYQRPLFEGYREVRTIYFDSAMTAKQRATFEKTEHLMRPPQNYRPNTLGRSEWCWLYGIREYNGRQAVAARFVFDWRRKKVELDYQADMMKQAYNGAPFRKVVDIFADELRAAGMIGFESLHCIFIGGVWCNDVFISGPIPKRPDSKEILFKRIREYEAHEVEAQLQRELEQ